MVLKRTLIMPSEVEDDDEGKKNLLLLLCCWLLGCRLCLCRRLLCLGGPWLRCLLHLWFDKQILNQWI